MPPLRIITFNGLGEPSTEDVADGDVLILVQGNHVSIVKLKLLPPDEYGPSLDPATNESELSEEARSVVATQYPDVFDSDRHLTLECPPDIAKRAVFRPQRIY